MTEVLSKKRVSGNVIALRKRRDESLSAALLKMEDIMDFVKMYDMKENKDVMRFILSDLKSKIRTSSSGEANYTFRYIETNEKPKDFAKNISDLCSDVYNNIVLREVSDFEKHMLEYLEYAEEHQIKRCRNSIDDIVCLFEISKNKKKEQDIFKIHTDILGCLNYNDKIQKEMELG